MKNTLYKENKNYTKLTKGNYKKFPLNIDFTCNKWGCYYFVDGEVFGIPLKNSNCDWFIYCERIEDEFYTTFIPNPKNIKNKSEICEEWYDEFFKETTYKIKLEEIREGLMNQANMVAVSRNGIINVTNYDFFHSGLYGIKVSEMTDIGKHSKTEELNKIIN